MKKNKEVKQEVDKKERIKKFDKLIQDVEKAYGKNALVVVGDDTVDKTVESFPSGSLSLDIALGIGGYPKGRIIEIYGQESSGKTTLTLHAIAELQKEGGSAAFIDAEHALDPIYAQNIGVNLDELLLSQPSCGEEALDIVERIVKDGNIDLIIIDSVAALTPRAEINGEMGDSVMGLHARLMSQAMRKLTAIVHKSKTTIILLNQIRDKIGILYGSPHTTTGGNALKFYASIRLEVSKVGNQKDGDEIIANKTKVKVVKNKVAPPFKIAEFDIVFGQGISKIGEIVDYAVNFEIIKKSGSWFSYGEMKLGQGREGVIQLLKDNEELTIELEVKIKDKIFGEVEQ
jgi:recombination protein RecA